MDTKSVRLSPTAIAWIEKLKAEEELNFSKAIEQIVLEHRHRNPDVKKVEAIEALRSSALYLSKECHYTQEIIVSWVKSAIGEE